MENKDQSGGSSSCSSENPNPCPICLGPVVEDSYLDKCFHKFCYNCIVHWTKVVASKHSSLLSSVKCPLCKKMFQSFMDMMELIFNGITLVKFLEIGILNDVFNVSRYWKSRKYLQSNQWLQSWLRREIQAVMQEEDVEIVVHHILGVVDSFLKRNKQRCQMGTPETKEEDFKALVSDAARPFLMARTDRFVNEMQLFLASALNIEAYDAVYMQRLGWNTPRVTMESGEGETSGQTPVIPYLHIFDEDSDGTD
ncbi:RING-type domain-containing protein [Citrus sinensis]|uniref:RING-type domain-containing protein n=3 Tax=Citrus sinensis TaxID=2711 RepID=A0ACB8KKY1_CITSI|nr:RING-type domain-containing protein [Citrus sinensis]